MADGRHTFWQWLFRNGDTAAGWRRLVDGFLALHLLVGATVARLTTAGLADAASVVLFPLAGVVIGLAFAWGANSVAMMQVPEAEEFAQSHAGGVREYLRVFQLGVLVVLTVTVAWGLCGLGVPQAAVALVFGGNTPACPRLWGAVVMFSLSSLAVRTAWQIVVGTQELLHAVLVVRRAKGSSKQG